MPYKTIALNRKLFIRTYLPLELSFMNNAIALNFLPHLNYLIALWYLYWLHQGLTAGWLYRPEADFCLGQTMPKATQKRRNTYLPNLQNNSLSSLIFLTPVSQTYPFPLFSQSSENPHNSLQISQNLKRRCLLCYHLPSPIYRLNPRPLYRKSTKAQTTTKSKRKSITNPWA